MPGPPLCFNDKKFEPIFLIVKGVGNQGKSTFCNALKSDTVFVVHADRWFYEYINPQNHKINLVKALSEFKDQEGLIQFIEKKINELPSGYKIYVLESYGFTIKDIMSKVCKLKKFIFVAQREK